MTLQKIQKATAHKLAAKNLERSAAFAEFVEKHFHSPVRIGTTVPYAGLPPKRRKEKT